MASSLQSFYHIENESAVGEGKKVGLGGVADKNSMFNFIFNPPPNFLFCSAAAAWGIIKNITRIFSA